MSECLEYLECQDGSEHGCLALARLTPSSGRGPARGAGLERVESAEYRALAKMHQTHSAMHCAQVGRHVKAWWYRRARPCRPS